MSSGPASVAAIAHIFDEEGAGARDGQQYPARPLVRDVRGAHDQGRTGLSIRQHIDCAQSHIGLARAALGDDARCLCLAQILGSPSDGKPLSR